MHNIFFGRNLLSHLLKLVKDIMENNGFGESENQNSH
jgi:hypothetical protein